MGTAYPLACSSAMASFSCGMEAETLGSLMMLHLVRGDVGRYMGDIALGNLIMLHLVRVRARGMARARVRAMARARARARARVEG